MSGLHHRSIVGQQLSVFAARAIYARLNRGEHAASDQADGTAPDEETAPEENPAQGTFPGMEAPAWHAKVAGGNANGIQIVFAAGVDEEEARAALESLAPRAAERARAVDASETRVVFEIRDGLSEAETVGKAHLVAAANMQVAEALVPTVLEMLPRR